MDPVVRAAFRQAGKLVLSLVPIFAFWFISLNHTVTTLVAGLIVGTALTIVFGWLKWATGILEVTTAVFFAFALVAVFGLQNTWIIEHLGIFPASFYFVAMTLSMILNRPFVAEYAREGLTPEQQNTPLFWRTSFVLSSFWAAVLLILTLGAVVQFYYPALGSLTYVFLQLATIFAAMAGQAVYVVHVKLTCRICGVRFASTPALAGHVTRSHPARDPGT